MTACFIRTLLFILFWRACDCCKALCIVGFDGCYASKLNYYLLLIFSSIQIIYMSKSSINECKSIPIQIKRVDRLYKANVLKV